MSQYRRHRRRVVRPEDRDPIPSPREIASQREGLGVPFKVAHNIWRFLHVAARGNLSARDTLEHIRDYLARVDPDEWERASVENLVVARRHPDTGDEVQRDDVGYYIDRGDWDYGTLVYLDGTMKHWVRHGERKGAYEPWEGYFIESPREIEERYEDWAYSQMDNRDVEEEGPREDDLWTDDARHFWSYRYGEHRGDTRYGRESSADKLVFKINALAPPDWLETEIERLRERQEDIVEEIEVRREAEEDCADLITESLALKERITKLAREYENIDDPWDGSSDAMDECERPGVWYAIEEGLKKHGYYGNVWFRRRGNWHSHDWKLLTPPKDDAWRRNQPWRKAAKVSREMVRVHGARPQKGDLFTWGLHAGAPYGVAFEMYGHPMQAPLVVTRAQARSGQGAALLASAIAVLSRQQGRPVSAWKGQPFSDPMTWQRIRLAVGVSPGETIDGVRRASRRSARRRRA